MAISITHKETVFGIGDKVSISLKIRESGKERVQVFEGIVIAIKNRGENKSFTVRKIGVHNIGIERIFPLSSPFLDKVKLLKKGTSGARRAKLYYIRKKSPREIEKIFSRVHKKEEIGHRQMKSSSKKKANAAKKK